MGRLTDSHRLPAVALWVVGAAAICLSISGIATLFNEQAEAERSAEQAGIEHIPGVAPLDALPIFLVIAGLGGALVAVGIFLWFFAGKTVKV